jgi:hypothetical protein
MVLSCLNKEKGISRTCNMNGRYKCTQIFGEDNTETKLKRHGIVRMLIPIIGLRIGFYSCEYCS